MGVSYNDALKRILLIEDYHDFGNDMCSHVITKRFPWCEGVRIEGRMIRDFFKLINWIKEKHRVCVCVCVDRDFSSSISYTYLGDFKYSLGSF